MGAYRKVFIYMLGGFAVGGVLAAGIPYVLLLNAYAGGGTQDWQFRVLDRGRDIRVARQQAGKNLLTRTLVGAGICSVTGAMIAACDVE